MAFYLECNQKSAIDPNRHGDQLATICMVANWSPCLLGWSLVNCSLTGWGVVIGGCRQLQGEIGCRYVYSAWWFVSKLLKMLVSSIQSLSATI